MVRGKGAVLAPKEILSSSEIAGLRDEQKELESTIRESEDGDRAVGVDISALKRRSAQIEHAIETRTPEEAKGKAKDSLVREERELEDFIANGMPSRYEMDHPARCPGAVRKHQMWCNRTDKAVRRYVEIQKILRPGEPKSVEALRKEK